VHLDVGGSDSDVSWATPAVNKSNASESAGASPYVSTSYTSAREQSPTPEESSLSTDSGMYSLQNLWVQSLFFGYPVQVLAVVIHPLKWTK